MSLSTRLILRSGTSLGGAGIRLFEDDRCRRDADLSPPKPDSLQICLELVLIRRRGALICHDTIAICRNSILIRMPKRMNGT